MIIFYIAVNLFWLVSVVMVFVKNSDHFYYCDRVDASKQLKVWMCMIVVTTFLMVHLHPDFLEAWALRQW